MDDPRLVFTPLDTLNTIKIKAGSYLGEPVENIFVLSSETTQAHLLPDSPTLPPVPISSTIPPRDEFFDHTLNRGENKIITDAIKNISIVSEIGLPLARSEDFKSLQGSHVSFFGITALLVECEKLVTKHVGNDDIPAWANTILDEVIGPLIFGGIYFNSRNEFKKLASILTARHRGDLERIGGRDFNVIRLSEKEHQHRLDNLETASVKLRTAMARANDIIFLENLRRDKSGIGTRLEGFDLPVFYITESDPARIVLNSEDNNNPTNLIEIYDAKAQKIIEIHNSIIGGGDKIPEFSFSKLEGTVKTEKIFRIRAEGGFGSGIGVFTTASATDNVPRVSYVEDTKTSVDRDSFFPTPEKLSMMILPPNRNLMSAQSNNINITDDPAQDLYSSVSAMVPFRVFTKVAPEMTLESKKFIPSYRTLAETTPGTLSFTVKATADMGNLKSFVNVNLIKENTTINSDGVFISEYSMVFAETPASTDDKDGGGAATIVGSKLTFQEALAVAESISKTLKGGKVVGGSDDEGGESNMRTVTYKMVTSKRSKFSINPALFYNMTVVDYLFRKYLHYNESFRFVSEEGVTSGRKKKDGEDETTKDMGLNKMKFDFIDTEGFPSIFNSGVSIKKGIMTPSITVKTFPVKSSLVKRSAHRDKKLTSRVTEVTPPRELGGGALDTYVTVHSSGGGIRQHERILYVFSLLTHLYHANVVEAGADAIFKHYGLKSLGDFKIADSDLNEALFLSAESEKASVLVIEDSPIVEQDTFKSTATVEKKIDDLKRNTQTGTLVKNYGTACLCPKQPVVVTEAEAKEWKRTRFPDMADNDNTHKLEHNGRIFICPGDEKTPFPGVSIKANSPYPCCFAVPGRGEGSSETVIKRKKKTEDEEVETSFKSGLRDFDGYLVSKTDPLKPWRMGTVPSSVMSLMSEGISADDTREPRFIVRFGMPPQEPGSKNSLIHAVLFAIRDKEYITAGTPSQREEVTEATRSRLLEDVETGVYAQEFPDRCIVGAGNSGFRKTTLEDAVVKSLSPESSVRYDLHYRGLEVLLGLNIFVFKISSGVPVYELEIPNHAVCHFHPKPKPNTKTVVLVKFEENQKPPYYEIIGSKGEIEDSKQSLSSLTPASLKSKTSALKNVNFDYVKNLDGLSFKTSYTRLANVLREVITKQSEYVILDSVSEADNLTSLPGVEALVRSVLGEDRKLRKPIVQVIDAYGKFREGVFETTKSKIAIRVKTVPFGPVNAPISEHNSISSEMSEDTKWVTSEYKSIEFEYSSASAEEVSISNEGETFSDVNSAFQSASLYAQILNWARILHRVHNKYTEKNNQSEISEWWAENVIVFEDEEDEAAVPPPTIDDFSSFGEFFPTVGVHDTRSAFSSFSKIWSSTFYDDEEDGTLSLVLPSKDISDKLFLIISRVETLTKGIELSITDESSLYSLVPTRIYNIFTRKLHTASSNSNFVFNTMEQLYEWISIDSALNDKDTLLPAAYVNSTTSTPVDTAIKLFNNESFLSSSTSTYANITPEDIFSFGTKGGSVGYVGDDSVVLAPFKIDKSRKLLLD